MVDQPIPVTRVSNERPLLTLPGQAEIFITAVTAIDQPGEERMFVHSLVPSNEVSLGLRSQLAENSYKT